MEYILTDRRHWSLGPLDQFVSRKGHSPISLGAVYSNAQSMITMKKEVMPM